MNKAPLGIIQLCGAPACDISTNKRYHREGVVVVACCRNHAETALSHARPA